MNSTRANPKPRGLTVLLLFGMALMSCGGCERAGNMAPANPKQELTTPSSEMGTWPENIEFGPANPRLRQLAGEMDVKNRYASTVMLSLNDPRELPDCSGILLAPRLVLTAASCFCVPKGETPERGRARTRADASSCASRIFVTKVVYGEVGDVRLKELTTEMEFQTTGGLFRPHPELEIVLDNRRGITERRADLAVVLLDEPMQEGSAEVLLPRDEAQVGEFLIMAGYGHDEAVGGFYGARYFRKNRVVGVRTSEGERILYEQQGAYAYNGFDGGPCFREEGNRKWLIGVAHPRVSQELACTSTTVYRDWILGELKRVDGEKKVVPSMP